MIQVVLKPEIEAQLVADAHAYGVEPVYAGAVIERAYRRGNGRRKGLRSSQEVRTWLDSLAQFSDKIPYFPMRRSRGKVFIRTKRSPRYFIYD